MKKNENVGVIRRMTGDEWLKAEEAHASAAGSPVAISASGQAASYDDAVNLARHGCLARWQPRPYEPGPQEIALSEVVQLRTDVAKLERMVRFLVERTE